MVEITFVGLVALIIWLIAKIAQKDDKIFKLKNLVSRLEANTDKKTEAYITLIWYAKKAALISLKARQYEAALRWYHDGYRNKDLPKNTDVLTFQEFLDDLVDKKILTKNWQRRDKEVGPLLVNFKDVLEEMRDHKPPK